MRLETLLAGPQLHWDKYDRTTCVLDLLAATTRAGIPIGPELGDALLRGNWDDIARLLPAEYTDVTELHERYREHALSFCKLTGRDFRCADNREDAHQFLRDAVKRREETTGQAVTAVAVGSTPHAVQVTDELQVTYELPEHNLTIGNLIDYLLRLEGVEMEELLSWALHDTFDELGGLFTLSYQYIDTFDGEEASGEAQMVALNAEQTQIFQHWTATAALREGDVRMLATADPEDYPIFRALSPFAERYPEPCFKTAFTRVQQHYEPLPPAHREVFLALLPNWEGPLADLAAHSATISAPSPQDLTELSVQ